MRGSGKIVCVTGASGFVASWLVKLLLEYGYTVRATIRDPSNPKKTEHLRALEGAKERLHLFKADLVKEGSFDAVIEGCDCVFHTASPVISDVKDLQAELIDPAVNGTLNVLRSCVKSSSVKRVVLTSSMATVSSNDRKLSPDMVVDETWFASSDFYQEKKQWYHLSKTLAEEAAWKFTKEHGIDMVVIIPGWVVGPLLQPTLNASSSVLLGLINGTIKELPVATIRGINVNDVAEAHILAYEVPSASGRYCLVERVIHYKEAVEIIRKLYPSLPLPEQCQNNTASEPTHHQVSKEKARTLGIDFIPLDQSFKEAIESLKEKGFVTL